MAENKKRAVGLVILTKIPAMGGLVAVLQRRGKFNHEKMGPETRPGGCQVTIHGKVEALDDCLAQKTGMDSFNQALLREIKEEFGDDFLCRILNSSVGSPDNLLGLEILKSEKSPEKEVRTYGLFVPSEVLGFAKLNSSTGGLEFVTREDVDKIQNLGQFDKTTGVTDLNIIAMFLDEIEAIREAFEGFGE